MKVKNNKLVLSEAQITEQCIGYLKAEGWTCRRNHVGTFIPESMIWGLIGQSREWIKKALRKNVITIGTKGDPDYLAYRPIRTWGDKSYDVHPGWCQLFVLELKTEAGVVSKDQKAEHERLRAAGIPVCVSRGIDDLRKWMRENL